MELDESTEREHLVTLIELLLERAFGESREFDHRFMSAGEGLGVCLDHFGAARFSGTYLRLEMPIAWILNKVRIAPLPELPTLSDVLDVMLSYEAQYGTIPYDYRTGQRARFASDVSRLLQQMGLLSHTGIPSDRFLLTLVNHHFLKPIDGAWDAIVEPLLKELASKTLDGAPDEYLNVLGGRSVRPLTWAEGYLNLRWRYGTWLTDLQLARAITRHHNALPMLITRTLAEGGEQVHVPLGYRRRPEDHER